MENKKTREYLWYTALFMGYSPKREDGTYSSSVDRMTSVMLLPQSPPLVQKRSPMVSGHNSPSCKQTLWSNWLYPNSSERQIVVIVYWQRSPKYPYSQEQNGSKGATVTVSGMSVCAAISSRKQSVPSQVESTAPVWSQSPPVPYRKNREKENQVSESQGNRNGSIFTRHYCTYKRDCECVADCICHRNTWG